MEIVLIEKTHMASPFSYVLNESFDRKLTDDELRAWCDERNMSGVVKVYYQGVRQKRHCYLFYYCED